MFLRLGCIQFSTRNNKRMAIQQTQNTNSLAVSTFITGSVHHPSHGYQYLPSLVKRIGSIRAIGIAHDAPGFGFTDRPNADIDGGLYQYGFESNVGIGVALMNESLAKLNNEAKKHIAIFGHSMGSKSALLMALYYASQQKQDIVPSLVVLVAPALEGVTLPSRRGYGLKSASRRKELLSNNSYWIRKLAKRVWIAWRKVFVDYPFRYGLRRLVW